MKFYLLIIAVAVILYAFLRPSSVPEQVDLSGQSAAQEVLAVIENPPSSQPVTAPKPAPTVAAPVVSDGVMGQNNMSSMLTSLVDCTEIKNSLPSNPVEPTLSSILDSVQAELGEPVIRSEDWNSTEIRLPNGSRRLIRLETVYEDNDIVKKLIYYDITKDALLPIELSSDQAVNPSETFIASLEKEGEVMNREKSERVFFQNGEEVMYTEKNGKLLTSEIIRAGKSLKCGDYGQQSFRCQCF